MSVRTISLWYTDEQGFQRCVHVRGELVAVDYADAPSPISQTVNTYACIEGETYRLVHKPGRSAKGKANKMLWERIE